MERLSGLDAMYLYLETPSQPLNVCCVLELDVAEMPGGYSFEQLRAELEPRLLAIPEFRKKLAGGQLNIDHPVWVECARVDISRHLKRIAAPAPGSRVEVGEVCAHIAALPLDRDHPLWEVWAVENPSAPELLTLVVKAHHALVDGVGGANIMTQLCSLEPDLSAPPDTVNPTPAAGTLRIAATGVLGVATRSWRLTSLLPATFATVARTVRRARAGRSMVAPFAAPKTLFNGPHSGRRCVAFVALSLDDVQAVKNHYGLMVNDVVMALCAGALRTFLQRHDALPDTPLVAAVPVSVHGKSDRPGRNQTSWMFCRLQSPVADPVQRLRDMVESTAAAKAHSAELGPTLLQDWTQFIGQYTMGAAKRLLPRVPKPTNPPFNLILSSVPGPQVPLYLARYRIEEVYPFGPILAGAGLNITAMSYNGQLGFGIISSPDLAPDLWNLADALPAALDELMGSITNP
ncbi:wax ester/triacylglycerol synthase family O-acyltransferase [Mycolicibacterium duvalii]|uniref:Diacylglycerol O-acyltransferase n=1 Tax=Mycolicibacterium duvalii TaxID=39688 RepID=A0A7I7JWI1_9MYCO|nr:wax ester/triacylglycerol synthase family O-acyltransferase [Mycolicibacterium duvalii]MCV7369433.1 wax ester/triacylglycerol synthase family O-acyltransferase [Mycolicibacterium duvalii]PEG40516.1 wax ester/triacylglycerol synthase family O-acyltransferase [Mycolicibacterium duvalii]BBX16153.1 putative diacyglycerol O-acyltransferase [Mycolicibacterium duvalii]